VGYLCPSEILGIVGAFYLAGVIIGIGLVFVIAGYDIANRMKTTVPVALISALLWIILGMLASYLARNFIVFPLEYGISQWTSATFFPKEFPAGVSGGKIP
jgi:multisubunit Na+/H+ antiporter MnhB subunit